jgi:mannitol/fructose-specific phosphotransferase system IIA component (Ntr-type)
MDNFKRIAFAFLATAIFTSFNDVTAQEEKLRKSLLLLPGEKNHYKMLLYLLRLLLRKILMQLRLLKCMT